MRKIFAVDVLLANSLTHELVEEIELSRKQVKTLGKYYAQLIKKNKKKEVTIEGQNNAIFVAKKTIVAISFHVVEKEACKTIGFHSQK